MPKIPTPEERRKILENMVNAGIEIYDRRTIDVQE